MQTKQNLVFMLVTLILKFILSLLTSLVAPSPNIKNLSLQLLKCLNQLILTPKLTAYRANSLSQLHDPATSNAIP